jgi:hypothetical protein
MDFANEFDDISNFNIPKFFKIYLIYEDELKKCFEKFPQKLKQLLPRRQTSKL